MSQTHTAIRNAAMKKRIVVDSTYIRNVYLKLRYELIQGIVDNNYDDTDQKIKDMDVHLIGIMKDVINGCDISDLKGSNVQFLSDKEVLSFLISNEDYIENIEEDKELSKKLKEEMNVFDDICITKGEKLNNFSQFSDNYTKYGEEKVAQYLDSLDSEIEMALGDHTDYEQLEKEIQEGSEATNIFFGKYRELLANSMFSLYNLESNGNLDEANKKYNTLKAKTEFLLEKNKL